MSTNCDNNNWRVSKETCNTFVNMKDVHEKKICECLKESKQYGGYNIDNNNVFIVKENECKIRSMNRLNDDEKQNVKFLCRN